VKNVLMPAPRFSKLRALTCLVYVKGPVSAYRRNRYFDLHIPILGTLFGVGASSIDFHSSCAIEF
jgi:hypothetical protein